MSFLSIKKFVLLFTHFVAFYSRKYDDSEEDSENEKELPQGYYEEQEEIKKG